MIEIIIFILPTFISMIIHDCLNKNDKNLYSIIKTFGGYCCLNNIVAMIGLLIYKGINFSIVQSLEVFSFVFRYFILSIFIATMSPIATEFIKKNVSIKIVFKEFRNEKEN